MASQAQLILQGGAGLDADRWRLAEGATTIGRWEGNDVVLPDREVSRKHAQIRHDGGQYVLVDLGSKNGTLVNGVRSGRATVLRDGDEIRIAPCYRFVFVDSDATVPVDPRPHGVRVDPIARTVSVAGQVIKPSLAPSQYALIHLLAGEPGRVYSRHEAAAACYPDVAAGVTDQALDGIVRRLRARLAEIDPDTEYVAMVRGHGIQLINSA